MRGLFDNFQTQFHRLDRERQEMENKLKQDKDYSHEVFMTVSNGKGDNLHDILKSRNMKYKRSQLHL